MDDIVGELRDCAADSAEVGYKSRAQVAMLRAADDIVALQGRIVRQCQSVNELVAATEKCIEERDALRARVAELEGLLKRARPRVESFAFTTKYEEEARAARELAREIRAGLAGGSSAQRTEAP